MRLSAGTARKVHHLPGYPELTLWTLWTFLETLKGSRLIDTSVPGLGQSEGQNVHQVHKVRLRLRNSGSGRTASSNYLP